MKTRWQRVAMALVAALVLAFAAASCGEAEKAADVTTKKADEVQKKLTPAEQKYADDMSASLKRLSGSLQGIGIDSVQDINNWSQDKQAAATKARAAASQELKKWEKRTAPTKRLQQLNSDWQTALNDVEQSSQKLTALGENTSAKAVIDAWRLAQQTLNEFNAVRTQLQSLGGGQ